MGKKKRSPILKALKDITNGMTTAGEKPDLQPLKQSPQASVQAPAQQAVEKDGPGSL